MVDFLRLLSGGATIEEPVALVAAHPDDEIVGLGSRLGRMRRLRIIHLTDGAPRDLADARREGCSDWRTYAAIREEETWRALHEADAGRAGRLSYGYPDQEAIWHADRIVERLARHLASASAVFTHPYEHGHPDHDTAALAVALACERLRADRGRSPERYEFASYHLREGRPAFGVFWPDPRAPALAIRLTARELRTKHAAMACFTSQRTVLSDFPVGEERVRRTPRYRFRRPAPPGAALYDRFGWRMTSALWRDRAARTMARCLSSRLACA